MMENLPAAAADPTEVFEPEFLFHSPAWLWALVPLLVLLFLRRKRGTAASVTHPGLCMVAGMLRKPRNLAGVFGPVMLVLGAACLVVALARPQWRNRHVEQKVSGIDIMIVCDLSGSMGRTDMLFLNSGTAVDRLTAAKQVITEFIQGRPNDRIGLVAFAGKAKLCCPLTLDHDIVRNIIDHFYLATYSRFGDEERPGYIREDGTAIGSAIATAATRLHNRRDSKSKIIILVTDGVNNRGKISPLEAARYAADMGIKIFTIAIGQDQRLSQYTADVESLDEETLRQIARTTNGQYYRASSGDSLQSAFDTIDSLEKTDAQRRIYLSHEELFPYPLLAAGAFLLLGCLLLTARPRPAP